MRNQAWAWPGEFDTGNERTFITTVREAREHPTQHSEEEKGRQNTECQVFRFFRPIYQRSWWKLRPPAIAFVSCSLPVGMLFLPIPYRLLHTAVQRHNHSGCHFHHVCVEDIPQDLCALYSLHRCPAWLCTTKSYSSIQVGIRYHGLSETSPKPSSELPLLFAVSIWYMSHFSREFFLTIPCPSTSVCFLVILPYSIMFFPFMAFIPICN